jgi:ABC-2 type transport system ATP-binding protein
MIETQKLTKYYGDRAAVREMTFEVDKGEIVGLLGPNGAGKTTTMRMLTGYLPASSGKAIVAGYDVADKPMEVRKRLGYLPETVPLYTDMPVRAYLDFLAKIRGVPGKGRRRRVEEVMELCQVADVADKVIGKLSRGYRQRVGLAQAIVHNPQVLILDEPTVGLDPRQIIEIRRVIRDLAGNHSMILSTHIMQEVSALCDRVIIVNRGRVLVEDTLANLERQETKGERLQVEVRGPLEEIRQMFGTMSVIKEVTTPTATTATVTMEGEVAVESEATPAEKGPGDVHVFDLQVEEGHDVRESLASMIIGRGWGLLELKTVSPNLEEIFVRLITEDLAQLEEEEAVEAGGYIETDTDLAKPMPGRATRRVAEDDEMEELAASQPSEDSTAEVEEIAANPAASARERANQAKKKKSVKPLAQRKAAPSFLTDQSDVAEDEEMDNPAPAEADVTDSTASVSDKEKN